VQKVEVLRQADIFYELPQEHLEKLAAVCREVTCQDIGEVIVQENTPSDELYIIVKGMVDIVLDPGTLGVEVPEGSGPSTITTLRPGQGFGEIGLVDRGLRSASARAAAKQTQLLAVSRDDLLGLCREDYHLGYLLMRNIAADLAFKIRHTDLTVREQLLWKPRS